MELENCMKPSSYSFCWNTSCFVNNVGLDDRIFDGNFDHIFNRTLLSRWRIIKDYMDHLKWLKSSLVLAVAERKAVLK